MNRRALLAAVLTPALFVALVLVLGALTPRYGPGWQPGDQPLSTVGGPLGTVAALQILALVGVLIERSWDAGLRLAPAFAVGGLVVVGYWSGGPAASPIDLTGFCSVVVLAIALEASARGRFDIRGTLRATGRAGVALALANAGLALGTQAVESGLPTFRESGAGGVALFALSLAVIAGFTLVAVGLYRESRLVAPAAVVAAWAAWAAVGFVQHLGEYPYSGGVGVNPLSLPPTPGYVLKWPVPLLALVVLGTLEYALRRGVIGRSGESAARR